MYEAEEDNATKMLDQVFRPISRSTEKFRQTHMNLELVKNIDKIIVLYNEYKKFT